MDQAAADRYLAAACLRVTPMVIVMITTVVV